MDFMRTMFGQPGGQQSTYNPNQLSFLDNMIQQLKGSQAGTTDITQSQPYGQGLEWLMSMFNDPEFFKSFEAPLQRQFQEQTVPDLANRFASMGSGGALGSTAFRNQLAREGSNLNTNIAALRGGMQQQAVPQLLGYAQQPFSNYMSMANQALTPTQNAYQQPSSGFFGPILGALSSGFTTGYGQQWGSGLAPKYNAGQSPSTF